jgi:hypothetical protein
MRSEKWVAKDTLSFEEFRLLHHIYPDVGDRPIIRWKKEICSLMEGDAWIGTRYKKYIGFPHETNDVQLVIYVPW